MLNYSEDYLKSRQEKEEEMLKKFREETILVESGLKILESKWEVLLNTFKKLHLVPENPGYHINSSLSGIQGCINANTDGSFKFIKDQGYDSRGRGKNQTTLDNKASKISETLNSVCDEKIKFSVNPFSLEKKDSKNSKERVLIDFYIYL